MAINFPDISPVLVKIGPLPVTWYGISYAVGILFAMSYFKILLQRIPQSSLSPRKVDDFLIWAVLGIVLGGRLGYVLFYHPVKYLENPLEIFQTWEGGMAFHGALLGMIVVIYWFCKKRAIPFFTMTDYLGCVAPIGFFLGRIANFINGELFGRVTDVPWAVRFPSGGFVPRHPSQLYEAFLEGPVLLLIMFLFFRPKYIEKPGLLTGVFLFSYGLFRFVVEFFRSPDAHIGFFFGTWTLGQMLSLPMIVGGLFLIRRTRVFCPFNNAC